MKITRIILVLVFLAVAALYTVQGLFGRGDGDSVPPVLTCGSEVLEISVADDDSILLTGVTATDARDGDITDRVMVSGVSRLIGDDTAKVTYVVFDSDQNMATGTRLIRYTDYQLPRFSLEEPLVYAAWENVQLLDRLHAWDVIDGDITELIRVSYLNNFDAAGLRTIDVQATNSMGDTAWLTLPVLLVNDYESWIDVELNTYLVYVEQGSRFIAGNYLTGASVDGAAISLDNVTISGEVDVNTPGTYMIEYTCSYTGRSGTAVLTVVVE